MKKIFLILLSLAVFSCNDYLDVNENVNDAFFTDVTPKLILPGAQLGAFRVQEGTMNQLGNVFMNSYAANIALFGGGFNDEYTLNLSPNFYGGIWSGIYRQVANFQAIIDYDNTDRSQDKYVAIAKILKAHYLQYIVDLYGDAPYTEAFKGFKNVTPKYDDDIEIYKALIKELEEARAIIADAVPNAIDPTNTDIMFGGDMIKWNKFANTIQLRYLVRMSNVTNSELVTYRDSKLDDLTGAEFLLENATINPGFSSSTGSRMTPLSTKVLRSDGSQSSTYNFIRASKHMANYLRGVGGEIVMGSGKTYPTNTDPREKLMWKKPLWETPSAPNTPIEGIEQGSSSAASKTSPIGDNVFNGYGKQSLDLSDTTKFPKNMIAVAANDGYVFTKSQSAFLLAEAAIRFPGKFTGISAQNMYITAIEDNLIYYGLPTFLKFIFNKTFQGDDDKKIEAIMTQKWIASTHINAIESFIDYNRTGYPITPLATTALESNKPYRLFYPTSEYSSNTENTPVLAKADIFTLTDKTPFWKK